MMKTVNALSRTLGRGAGTVAGGRVALRISPGIVSHLLTGREVFAVSGTNGKTTTTALLVAALGGSAATNATGSNMLAGVLAALEDSTALKVVLEVDEAFLAAVVDASRNAASVTVLLLNLSRDQLDRASEVRQMAERWHRFLGQVNHSNLRVVANVADPLVFFAVRDFQGVNNVWVPTPWREDSNSCPNCTNHIVFCENSWSCTCGLGSPVSSIVLSDVLTTPEGAFPLTLLLPGDFNRSNAAMALAAAHLSGVEWNQALGRVSSVTEVAGRFSRRVWQGRTWRILLAKNPAGVAALLQSVVLSGADVVVDINDGLADGLDPSWIYDAPFELLRGRMVWCEGSRQLDVATRLSYDDVKVSIASELSREVPPGDVIDVIANYTAFAKWIERSSPC